MGGCGGRQRGGVVRDLVTLAQSKSCNPAVTLMVTAAIAYSDAITGAKEIQMLGLSFLILIGFMLIAEGCHQGDVVVLDAHVGTIPRGYLYFAIAFSLFVEFLNIRMRKRKRPIQLHNAAQEAIKEGLMEKVSERI